jgi:hypothetical protein
MSPRQTPNTHPGWLQIPGPRGATGLPTTGGQLFVA